MLRRALTPLLIVASACHEPVAPVPPKATSVSVTPTAVSLWMRDTVRFTATAHYADGSAKQIASLHWVSNNVTALTIDSSGLATVALQTTLLYPETDLVTVTASLDSVIGNATATITQVPPISLTPNPNYLMTGMTRPLLGWTTTYVSSRFVRTSTNATSWTSSDPAVLTVDDTGVVTTRGPGPATILARFTVDGRDVSAAATFTVIAAPSRRYSSAMGGLFASRYGQIQNRECALSNEGGGVYCWGVLVPNTEGFDGCEFGSPLGRTFSKACSEVPVRLLSTPVFTAMSAGSFGGCALSDSQSVYCWGTNEYGQIGDGTKDIFDVFGWVDRSPTAIASSDRFRSVHAMGDQHCAIRIDGAAFCWGHMMQPGFNPGEYSKTPVRLGSILWNTLAEFSSASGCGLASDSTAYCWSADTVPSPRQIDASLRFAAIDAYGSRGCGLASAGKTSCWFYSKSSVTQAPTPVSGGQSLVFIGSRLVEDGYDAETCGLTAAGDMYCVKQTGTAPNVTFSAQPLNLGVKLKRFGGTCGIGLDDKAYCWDWSTLKVRLIPGQ